ncbi:MAG: hypothetical protein MK110_10800 [Fuerstiella sp.]|nr:hypothetical protein [Fuerstiella sp.]
MPDAAVLATILLVVGLFLVGVELMVPSFGLIGMSAALCLAISAWSAYQAWWSAEPAFFWTYLGFMLAGIPLSFFGTLYLIQRTALGSLVILKARNKSQDGPSLEMQSRLHDLIGRAGKTVSPLIPGGMVEIGGERHHAECTGPFVDSGLPIEVTATRGTRLVVRRFAPAPDIDTPADSGSNPDGLTDSGCGRMKSSELDFDVPDNYTQH